MNSLCRKVKSALLNGECQYGLFLKSGDPMFVEVAGLAGFDYVILDNEHGPLSVESQQNNIRAAVVRNTLPLIRVGKLDEHEIGRALDIGAGGLHVPQINNADAARRAVEYTRFHPYGNRGVCRFVRAADYAYINRDEYFEQSKDLLLVIHLEGQEAIQNIDEIMDVDGVDVLFVGTYDLSQSLGIPGQIEHPSVVEAMQNIIAKAKQKNKVVGAFVEGREQFLRWKRAGVQYLNFLDIDLFKKACDNIISICHEE